MKKGVWEERGETLSLCATALRWGFLGLKPAKIPTGQCSPGTLAPAPGTSGMVALQGSTAAGRGSQPGWGSQWGKAVGGRGDGRGGQGLTMGTQRHSDRDVTRGRVLVLGSVSHGGSLLWGSKGD